MNLAVAYFKQLENAAKQLLDPWAGGRDADDEDGGVTRLEALGDAGRRPGRPSASIPWRLKALVGKG